MDLSELRFCTACSKDIFYKNFSRHINTNVHKRNVEKAITNKDYDLWLGDIFPFDQSLFYQENNYNEVIDIGDFRPSAIFKEGILYNIQHTPTIENLSIFNYMKLFKSKGISEIITALEKNNSINNQFYLTITLLNMFSDEIKIFYIPLKKEVVYKHMNLNKFWISQRDTFIDELDNRDLSPSGLTFYGVKMLEILIFRNISDGGCSYFELSNDIKNRKAVINVKNTTNKCFM